MNPKVISSNFFLLFLEQEFSNKPIYLLGFFVRKKKFSFFYQLSKTKPLYIFFLNKFSRFSKTLFPQKESFVERLSFFSFKLTRRNIFFLLRIILSFFPTYFFKIFFMERLHFFSFYTEKHFFFC